MKFHTDLLYLISISRILLVYTRCIFFYACMHACLCINSNHNNNNISFWMLTHTLANESILYKYSAVWVHTNVWMFYDDYDDNDDDNIILLKPLLIYPAERTTLFWFLCFSSSIHSFVVVFCFSFVIFNVLRAKRYIIAVVLCSFCFRVFFSSGTCIYYSGSNKWFSV